MGGNIPLSLGRFYVWRAVVSSGFIVRGATGDIQVDGNFQNHKLLAAGSASFPEALTNRIYFSSTSITAPMVAIRSAINQVIFQPRFVGVPGNWTEFAFSSTAGVVNYLIFDANGAAPDPDTHGVMVLDGAGAQVFDSRRRYLVMDNEVNIYSDSLPPGVLGNHAIGASSYLVVNGLSGHALINGTLTVHGFNDYYLGGVRFTSSTNFQTLWHRYFHLQQTRVVADFQFNGFTCHATP